ncbi:sporulation protein YpjB [Paenibacillus sp. MMS20-IR301]|uniref:sporulation protein YpjB n=1 Tax=Paenibacillus sp. MMS20-IR301 TaxID=2895946 RepID=UPI0028E5B1F7|nr:sporulation protein YpjB [Paenibacillus sp. MMS20-IR301]WNS44519.1 sporulation protein YpjB [Paenibacillus sp. MMS20-IR301]
MPRGKIIAVTGIMLCWLLAGVHSGKALADAEAAAAGTASETYIEAASVTVSDPAALTGRSGAQRLEQAAEAFYGYVLEGNVLKARQVSEQIAQIFISSSFDGLTTVEGINALSAVIMDMKSALAAVEPAPEKWEAVAARLRLAANSLNHPRQPMWLQYYKLVREDLNDMEQSAAGSDLKSWKAALSRLQSRYETIRPAVIISSPPEAVKTFDSWLSYAEGVGSSPQPLERARLLEIVSYGQDAVRVLFGKERDEPALSLPLAPQQYGAWGALAGAFIFSVLIYAAYRKYRGQNGEWKAV